MYKTRTIHQPAQGIRDAYALSTQTPVLVIDSQLTEADTASEGSLVQVIALETLDCPEAHGNNLKYLNGHGASLCQVRARCVCAVPDACQAALKPGFASRDLPAAC